MGMLETSSYTEDEESHWLAVYLQVETALMIYFPCDESTVLRNSHHNTKYFQAMITLFVSNWNKRLNRTSVIQKNNYL